MKYLITISKKNKSVDFTANVNHPLDVMQISNKKIAHWNLTGFNMTNAVLIENKDN